MWERMKILILIFYSWDYNIKRQSSLIEEVLNPTENVYPQCMHTGRCPKLFM